MKGAKIIYEVWHWNTNSDEDMRLNYRKLKLIQEWPSLAYW